MSDHLSAGVDDPGQLVQNAVRWVLNLETGDATPNPAVSKSEEAKAKAAVK